MRKKLLMLAMLLALTLGAAACAKDPAPEATEAPESTEAPAEDGEGLAIRGFSATTLEGEAVTDEIFQDAKLTLVNVWTTWCSPCIREMPDLAAIAKEMAGDGVGIVGITLDAVREGTAEPDEETIALAKTICESSGVAYTVLVPDEVLLRGPLKDIVGVPTSYFVDSKGNVIGEPHVGSLSKEAWEELIRETLAR